MTNNHPYPTKEQAALVLSLTDLTTLEKDDTREKVQALCHKATQVCGHTAAVCIYPEHIKSAKEFTAGTDVAVATVVNFPESTYPLDQTLALTQQAITDGVAEVDLVFPYKDFLYQIAVHGRWDISNTYLTNNQAITQPSLVYIQTIAQACHQADVKLKVIIESGKLVTPYLIKLAAQTSIQAGADFIKTSTGKTPVNATLKAAQIMLEAIKEFNPNCGFKASGGIRTVSDALDYIELARKIMGDNFITKAHFRFGASGIFNDIKSILETGKPLEASTQNSY